jgi:cytoskeletal protein RodZ
MPDTYWQPPTETVRPAPQGPGGYAAPPQPGEYGPPPGGYPTAAFGAPYPPGPAGVPPQRGGRGRTGLLVVLAIIIVLAAGGGAYALAARLGKHSTASPSSPPPSSAAASSPTSATQPATGTGSASASASASASNTSPSSSPTLVAVGPGVSGPAVPAVQQLLSKRFEGINTHNYAEYASTLTTRAQAIQTQASFDKGYRSTSDSSITLTALNQTSSGLTATVAFTSHQNPADSGDGSACNTWTTTYYLVPSGSGYLIDNAPAGSPAPDRGDC